jgi:hypothetical protein
MSGRDTASLETGAAKAANSNVDDLSEVIRDLDRKAQGEFSLRLLLAGRSPDQLRHTVPAVHRIFVDARAQVMEETLGNLSAFYAMFPGNHKFNVFPLWLAEGLCELKDKKGSLINFDYSDGLYTVPAIGKTEGQVQPRMRSILLAQELS